jgi:hypothetical protein
MRRTARGVIAVAAALAIAAGASPHPAEAARARPPRFVIEPREVVEDEPVFVCTENAPPPEVVSLDGLEALAPVLFPSPAESGAPRAINVSLRWPARGPLVLYRAIDARPRADADPIWGQDAWLRPGRYLLHAEGFRPETLVVRAATAAERRTRGVLARARRYAAAGDSAYAARLLEELLERELGGPFATAAFLALGELLPYTRWHARPSDWLGEWIARRLMECVLPEGMRIWLARGGDARQTLSRLVSRYPGTPAAEAASTLLAAEKAPSRAAP